MCHLELALFLLKHRHQNLILLRVYQVEGWVSLSKLFCFQNGFDWVSDEDVAPSSILKCFFSVDGKIFVNSIFSPLTDMSKSGHQKPTEGWEHRMRWRGSEKDDGKGKGERHKIESGGRELIAAWRVPSAWFDRRWFHGAGEWRQSCRCIDSSRRRFFIRKL